MAVTAVTFDDFGTLRYSTDEENIIYPIFRALRKNEVEIKERDFLDEYFRADKTYRKSLKESSRELLLDDIIEHVLLSLGNRLSRLRHIVRESVNEGLVTRNVVWYPDAFSVLTILRRRGYKLGLITNTHWRLLDETRKEFKKYFDVITLSYEHGYAKPHPSIFLVKLEALGTDANNCLHIGDDPIADIQGAKSVAMKTAFIKRGKGKADADIQIEWLSELTELL